MILDSGKEVNKTKKKKKKECERVLEPGGGVFDIPVLKEWGGGRRKFV